MNFSQNALKERAIPTESTTSESFDSVGKETVFLEQIEQVEDLAHQLKHLLVNCEQTFQDEGVRRPVEVLERWAESYRKGIQAAHKMSSFGIDWLAEIRDRLKQSAEELQRLEGEGGNLPPSPEQESKNNDIRLATLKIEKILPTLEQMLLDSHREQALVPK